MSLVNFWRKKKGHSGKEGRIELEKLFDNQLRTFKDRGVSQDILAMFLEKRPMVIEKAENTHILEGIIPFLPVIPREFLTIYSQMPMVYHTNKKGVKKTGRVSNLNPNYIHDIVEVPKVPYHIFEVVDSIAKTLGKTPQEADERFKHQIRSGLTDCEVISLCIHTTVLSTYGVYAVNSDYGNGYEIVALFLNSGLETPELSRWIISKVQVKCCSASCRLRI